MINKILEKRLFKGRNLESTSTVCKIRNSESARIIIENVSGKKDVIDLSECDVNTEEGLRKHFERPHRHDVIEGKQAIPQC